MDRQEFEEVATAEAKSGRRLPSTTETKMIQEEYLSRYNDDANPFADAQIVRQLSEKYHSINVTEALREVIDFGCL